MEVHGEKLLSLVWLSASLSRTFKKFGDRSPANKKLANFLNL
jgi:hypothetical protein